MAADEKQIRLVKKAIKFMVNDCYDEAGAEKLVKSLRKSFGIPEPKVKVNTDGAW